MDIEREHLWDSTSGAHRSIQELVYQIIDVARGIGYLHPKVADDLTGIAKDIEYNRRLIQGNNAELVNLDIRDSERAMGRTLVALLNHASGGVK